jgi:hypothetical protein
MLSNILNKVAENILKEDKLILRKVGCSVPITQVIARVKGFNLPVYFTFISCIKAFDMVNRYKLILYFSILLHSIVQWVLQVMCPSACSCIVLVFHCWTLSLHVSAYLAIFKFVHVFLYLRSLLHCFLVKWTHSA